MLGRSNSEVGSVTGLMSHDYAFRIYGGECECHRAVDLRIVLSIDMRLKPAFAPTAKRPLKRPVSLPSPQARCHETSRRRSRDPTRHSWAQGEQRLQNELGGHAYGSPQAAEDRALIGKEAEHAVGGLPMTLFRLEPQSHMNVSDDEHVVLDFDLAERFGYQPVARRIDLTRFQRASKGSRQSTRGRRHNIIHGCGVRQNRSGNFIMRAATAPCTAKVTGSDSVGRYALRIGPISVRFEFRNDR